MIFMINVDLPEEAEIYGGAIVYKLSQPGGKKEGETVVPVVIETMVVHILVEKKLCTAHEIIAYLKQELPKMESLESAKTKGGPH